MLGGRGSAGLESVDSTHGPSAWEQQFARLIADSCFMGGDARATDEQLVARAHTLLQLLSHCDVHGHPGQDLPHLVSRVRAELAGLQPPSGFGQSLDEFTVRYSLRDGWNLDDQVLLTQFAAAQGWLRVHPGGLLVLEPAGEAEAGRHLLPPRERLAIARAAGIAPRSVPATSSA